MQNPIDLQQLQRMRTPGLKEIRGIRQALFFATAGAAAATASDVVDNVMASALGNFGLLLIMIRFWFIAPQAVAMAKKGDPRWVKAEADFYFTNFPWAELVGRAGWILLFFAVLMQLMGIP